MLREQELNRSTHSDEGHMNRDGSDLPVLLVFWARPRQFARVFEQVKRAKPRKLFLYQDGPREGRADDITNVQECRAISEQVDWDCEVHRFDQAKNVGCAAAVYTAIKWAFEHVDRCVILEDDVVPAQSFFSFCKEMFERYDEDQRIGIICGMNNCGISSECPYDYLFSKSGSIWGWATWKRIVDLWDESLGFLDRPYERGLVEAIGGRDFIRTCERHRSTGRPHFESILGASCFLNNTLNIVPKYNMTSNVGIGENTTHSSGSVATLPKGIRRVFNAPTYEIEFPLKHPNHVIENMDFKKKLDRIMGNGHPWIRCYRQWESILRRCVAGDFASLAKGMRRRWSR